MTDQERLDMMYECVLDDLVLLKGAMNEIIQGHGLSPKPPVTPEPDRTSLTELVKEAKPMDRKYFYILASGLFSLVVGIGIGGKIKKDKRNEIITKKEVSQ